MIGDLLGGRSLVLMGGRLLTLGTGRVACLSESKSST